MFTPVKEAKLCQSTRMTLTSLSNKLIQAVQISSRYRYGINNKHSIITINK